jgi:hypothetical protein
VKVASVDPTLPVMQYTTRSTLENSVAFVINWTDLRKLDRPVCCVSSILRSSAGSLPLVKNFAMNLHITDADRKHYRLLQIYSFFGFAIFQEARALQNTLIHHFV